MKRISFVVLGVIVSLLIWYFFLNPADYTVTFKVNTLPGTISQTLKVWNSESNANIVAQDGLESISQQFVFNDSIHNYDWSFKAVTDSSSVVSVKIKDQDHSLANRLKKYFTETDFERRSASNTKAFFDYLKRSFGTVQGDLRRRSRIGFDLLCLCACSGKTRRQGQRHDAELFPFEQCVDSK